MLKGPIQASKEEFYKFQGFVKTKIGLKFPESKKSLLESRLSNHIQKIGFDSFNDYFEFVMNENNKEELDYLIDKLTTHTTSFFREIEHFKFLAIQGINLINAFYSGATIKIASLGSSTGEEMYTLAMIFATLKRKRQIYDYQIDAMDISKKALMKAKSGIFKLDHLNSIPKQFKHFFTISDNLYAKPELTSNLRFFLLNICRKTQKFPDDYHIIFCRNTLIYFNKQLQQNVVNNISRILHPHGLVFIGHSESLHGLNHSYRRLVPTVYQGG